MERASASESPSASSTPEGFVEPGVAGGPRARADALEVHRHEQRLGVAALERDRERAGQARRAGAVHARARHGREEPRLEPVTQGADARRLRRQRRDRGRERGGEPGDAGQVLGPGAAAALLLAARERREREARA